MRRLSALFLLLAACGQDAPVSGPGSAADAMARARAAAWFQPGLHQNLDEARAAMAPLVARPDATLDDLVRAAVIDFHDVASDPAPGTAWLERARALDPESLPARWMSGNYAMNALAFDEAAEHFRFVVERDPSDAAARLRLGEALDYLGDMPGALEQYHAVRALGLGPNQGNYFQATYKLQSAAYRLARDDASRAEAEAISAEWRELKAAGLESPSLGAVWIGRYGDVRPDAPRPQASGAPAAPLADAFDAPAPLGAAAHDLALADVDGDGRIDALLATDAGVFRASPGAAPELLLEGAAERLAAADLDQGDPMLPGYAPAPELLVVGAGVARLGQRGPDGSWSLGAPLTDARVNDGLFADLDHDGGLDLVLATDGGLVWLRNQSRIAKGETSGAGSGAGSGDAAGAGDAAASGEGSGDTVASGAASIWRDATPASFAIGPCSALAIEDLDDNQAVDLVVLAGERLVLLAGMWGGVFEDHSAAWGLDAVRVDDTTRAGGLALDDLDLDGRPDLLLASGAGLAAYLGGAQGFSAAVSVTLDAEGVSRLALDDLDADGLLDLVARDGDGAARVWRGPLVARDAPLSSSPLGAGGGPGPVAIADLDGDLILDVVTSDAQASTWAAGRSAPGRGLRLALEGHKDNAQGIGAVIELRSGARTRRLFAAGQPLHIGLADGEDLDVLFVRWPNGVHQHAFDLAAGQVHVLEQDEGLGGSCPFLYTWNGERFEFISDVLGTTPLGLPMTPELMVPFDHDEWVLVRGDQLVPRDGMLELVLTEELREVTYLDRVSLHAIDHPSEVEIQPNEAFTFPPFLSHHIHSLADVRAPARVLTDQGVDVTAQLAAVDGKHARPFEYLPQRFRGLTEPWALELTLAQSPEERAALAAAPQVRLALTGWLLWGDASVNLSAAGHPDIAFEAPRLSVPDGSGGWRPTGPPIGFVAGKTKTMVVDLTDVIDRDDPRLRLDTSLAMHYDAIRLVLDDDDAPRVQTDLEAASARLAFRGFSERLIDPAGEYGELFDWNHKTAPRWDQHPGRYTRYGDVLPLLGAIDDRYVIFGAGDALTLSFPADGLPPLPEGWSRDWLVFADGWAKDRDPNTQACRTVEPLPYHGMQGYPPADGRIFPGTEEELAWDAEWNTRAGAVLVERLSASPGGGRASAGR